jgi:hypothetical protein
MEMIPWNAPSCILDHSDRNLNPFSLDFLPLSELRELFHTRKASDQRDKVFALLSISHTIISYCPPPQPDYTMGWSTVFQQTVNHLLGPLVAVTTWDSEIHALIAGRGRPFGRVTDRRDGFVRVESRSLPGPPNAVCSCDISWRDGIYCKDIEIGDILWQTERGNHFSIIRFCRDHFDVIMVHVEVKGFIYNANKHDYDGAVILPGNQLQSSRWGGYRKALLVWDWLPISQQNPERHCVFFQEHEGDLTVNESHLSRISDCARIFDDLRDHETLSVLTSTILELQDGSKMSAHSRLLKAVCSHWPTYEWIKSCVEETRWCLWKLKAVPYQQVDSYASVVRYWSEGNCLSWDAIDIAALDQTPLSTGIQTMESGDSMDWKKLDPLPLSMFPGYADVLQSSGTGNLDQFERLLTRLVPGSLDQFGRFLIRLILAQKDLRPSLSMYLRIFSGLGGEGLEYTVQNGLSTLAIISEHTEHKIRLSAKMLETIAKHKDAFCYFTFLLAECYKDIEKVYNILATAILSRPPYFDVPVGTPRRIYFSCEQSLAAWCHDNIKVLDNYASHTNLVAIAESHENDTVIPTLIAAFGMNDDRSVFSNNPQRRSCRATILRNIDRYRKMSGPARFR